MAESARPDRGGRGSPPLPTAPTYALPPIKPARPRCLLVFPARCGSQLSPDVCPALRLRCFFWLLLLFSFYFTSSPLATTAAVRPSQPPRPSAGPGPAVCWLSASRRARRGGPGARRGACSAAGVRRWGGVLAGFCRGHPGRLVRLLLFCLCLPGGSLAGLLVTTRDASPTQENALTQMHTGQKSSAEPITTTQTVSQTTWDSISSISDHLTLGQDVSTPGSDLTTSDFKGEISLNKSKSLYVEYEVILAGESDISMQKNVTLGSAVKIELSCRLADKYSSMKIIQVTWKRGNETIKHISKSKNSWAIQLTISENRKLGSYTCTVKGEKVFSVVFHLQVPQIEGREKPVISYEGDSAILICKSHSYTPIAWTWYMTNGSEQIAINDSLMLDKYIIDRVDANVTHLKILNVTKEDGGAYWCEAAFELGKSKGKLKLNILSLMVPLKPFLAIVAEVIILITLIFAFELYSKRREKRAEVEREFDQIEQLKSEESNGVESSSARHRRV